MSAEPGWIIEPRPNPNSVEAWVGRAKPKFRWLRAGKLGEWDSPWP